METIWWCDHCHASGLLEHTRDANVYDLLAWIGALHQAHPRACAAGCVRLPRDLRVMDSDPLVARSPVSE